MEGYEAEVQAMERARASDPPASRPVVFYGSSSIRMWNSLATDFQDVTHDAPIRNLGFGGSTLVDCVWFFERLVVPYQPRSLVVYAGDNDLGSGRTPDEVVHAFGELSQKITRHLGPIPLAFLSIKPSLARWSIVDRVRETNARVEQALATREHGHYIDIFSPTLGNDGLPRRELFLDDGLHPSAAGYQVWTQVLKRYREEIF